jgi:Asp/Glu/hydantoin racemase
MIERARRDHAWGRDFAARIETHGEMIQAAVISLIGDHGLDVVKERVEDTLAGIQLSPVTIALNLN